MSDGYTKLFADIVDSSIWEEPPETCKVWVTLLALCNADGYVRGSVGWLAVKARVSIQSCTTALDKFQSHDPHSRTPDNEGRRVEQLEDGWLILNYLSFRDRLSSNPKAVATRIRVQKHRARFTALRNANSVTPIHSASASVSVHKDRGVGEEVELPSGFPQTESDAVVHSAFVGCPSLFSVKTWNKAMSRHGHDSKGQPIRSFRHYLQTEWSYEQERQNVKSHIKVFPDVQLNEVEDQISKHPCNRDSLVHNPKADELTRQSFRALIKKRDELKQAIASAPIK